jgi:hypothetical protein
MPLFFAIFIFLRLLLFLKQYIFLKTVPCYFNCLCILNLYIAHVSNVC